MTFLIVALYLQLVTYVPGTEAGTCGVAFALTINAVACFLGILRYGGAVARLFASLWLLAAMFDTFNLVEWAFWVMQAK